MEELKVRVHKAETASEEYQRQLSQLQTRLGDSLKEQERLEERTQHAEERIVGLEEEKRESQRQRIEVESQHEADRASMLLEREEQAQREAESNSIIQRLKEALMQKDTRASLDDESRASRNGKDTSQTPLEVSSADIYSEFEK